MTFMKPVEDVSLKNCSRTFGSRFVVLLLIGVLSMVFAEVYSGASLLWFINLWSLLVTFPLYWSHFLLLFTLAVKTKRYRPWQLYLWGCIFGLYESWITKVIWSSFNGQSPLIGRFLGFAIGELFLVTFFWHPIMSFIAPIVVFEVFSSPFSNQFKSLEKQILCSHMSLIRRSKRNLMITVFITIFGASISTINFNFNIFMVSATILGSLLVIFVLHRLCTAVAKSCFSICSLVLKRLGFTFVAIYLVFLYVFSYMFILPERIPSPITQLITLMLYVFVGLLLYFSEPSNSERKDFDKVFFEREGIFSTGDIYFLYGLFYLLSIVFCFTPILCFIIATCCLFIIIASGAVLVLAATVKVIYKIRSNKVKR